LASADLIPGWAGAPWLAAVGRDLAAFGDDPQGGRWRACLERLSTTAAARGIANENAQPLRFVDASTIDAPAYEQHIWRTGEVPTRLDGEGAWHDFLNALVWLALPRVKARLNRLQAAAIERDGIGARRGALRDAATLFDENAVLVLAGDPEVAQRLRAHDWQGLFVRGRSEFEAGVRVIGFGHALLDKLRAPYKSICAHAWAVTGERAERVVASIADPGCAEPALPAIDELVAATLEAQTLVPSAFSPLPVLGVPGWWPENSRPGFYEDEAVFRPPRARRAAAGASPSPARCRLTSGPRPHPEGVSQ
jgi:hypothetical protein